MSELTEVQGFIQAYAEAVSSILEAEVTVVDRNLIRIGGTGEYAGEVGKRIAHETFFQQIIDTGRPGTITDVRKSLSCRDCEKRDTCRELANLGYPIVLEGKVVGVVGIIAFNRQTRERLLKKPEKLAEFLRYMSMLIESKLSAEQERKALSGQIEGVIEQQRQNESPFIGEDPKTKQVLNLARKISRSDSAVLITGESGTGKELLARLIHAESSRCPHLMITMNCAAVPEEQMEKELFGREEDAALGRSATIGKFELAEHSTLFLEEIGEMPLHIQSLLLQTLQEMAENQAQLAPGAAGLSTGISGAAGNGGGAGSRKTMRDVRVIASADGDLWKAVEEGRFRRDLYYRLNVLPIPVPPLRERGDDVRLLIHHFLGVYQVRMKKHIRGITPEAEEILASYSWPGNVQELKNMIEYLTNIVDSGFIRAADLPQTLVASAKTAVSRDSLAAIMADYEKIVLSGLIGRADTAEKKEALARQLGISRATLYRKLAEYGLR